MLPPQAGSVQASPPTPAGAPPFQLLADLAFEGILCLDGAGRITFANSAAQRMFGYAGRELLGAPVDPLIPESVRGPHQQRVIDFAQGPPGARMMSSRPTVQGLRRDGTVFPAEASIAKLELDGQPVIAVILRDVSERQQLEDHLRHSEARYREIMQSASDAIFITDGAGRFIEVNRRAGELLGCSADQIVGQRIADFLPRDAAPRMEQVLGALRAGAVHFGEWQVRRADGAYADIEVSSKSMPDRHIVTVVRDISPRKRDEQERQALQARIEAKRARLQAILDHAPVGIALWNITGPPLMNDYAAQLLGLPVENLLQRGRAELLPRLIHPDGTPLRFDELATTQAMERGAVVRNREYLVSYPDGSRHTLLGNAAPIRDAQGRITGAVWAGLDTTDRTQMERALRESEERFRATFQHAPVGMCLLDLQGRFHHANSAFCRLVGHTEDELRARSFMDLTHPEDAPLNAAAVTELREGRRTSYETRKRFLHKDGHVVWVQLSAALVRDSAGLALHTMAQALDISDQVRAERALRVLAEAGARINAALDARRTAEALADLIVAELADTCRVAIFGPDGMVIEEALRATDREGEAALRELSGPCPYDPARFPPLADVLQADELRVVSITEEWLSTVARDAAQIALARRLQLTQRLSAPLRARGHRLGALLLGRSAQRGPFMPDELHLIEELARRASVALDNGQLYEEAQRAIGARDNVLRIVAHDLRNPLSAINMAAGHMLLTGELDPQHEVLAESITRGVARANRLIGDLLDAAQIAAGKLRVAPASYRPHELVSGAVEPHRMLLSERGLVLQVEVEEGLPEVQADRDRFQQVVGNLLSNAARFTPAGGQITVRAGASEGRVRFSVSDTGPGLSQADQQHLFAPFWKAHPEDRRGAGLGLSIARGLVEAQGGRIWVESQEGAGATFCFTLPTAERARAAAG